MSVATDPPASAGGAVPLDRRTVTVLFADVVRSTQLIEHMDVEDALAVLGAALAAMTQAVRRYSGTVAKPLGDGIMAMFGAPLMQEDHARRACLAALAMQEEIATLSLRFAVEGGIGLQLRVGLSSGPVVVTAARSGHDTSYDAVGLTVHLAYRIQAEAAPGAIWLSEPCWRHVRRAFACQALGPHPMKGFNEPQAVYALLPAQTRQPERLHVDYDVAAPLFGRAAPLAALERAVDRLVAGEGGLVLIVGEAGLGKSRLLAEARHFAPEGLQWLEGQSPSFSQQISYWPFVELIRPLLAQGAATNDEAAWNALEASTVEYFGAAGAADVLPYVATLVGMEVRPPYDERVRHLESEALGAQIMRAAWRWFEGMARRRPLVIALEDLHWADRSSRALLEHLVPLAASVPILFLVVSRPEPDCLDPLRALGARAVPGRLLELTLGPLAPEESRALMVSLLGDDPRTRRIQDVILAKADGNPFFIEEVMRAFIDARVVVPGHTPGSWTVQGQDIVIPDTIQGVVMARVDRLDDRLKDVLNVASVIGRTFFYRVLRTVTAPDSELDEPLARLAAIAFVEEMRAAPELAYLFKHALAHEAIYESILHDRRRKLHASVAECLEVLYADRLQPLASVLAFHYARAELWPKALHFMLEAAEQSSHIAADDEALAHYEHAVEAYGRAFGGAWDTLQRASIDRRLGEIYLRRGDHSSAEQHLTQALARLGEHLPTRPMAIRFAVAGALARHGLAMLLPRIFTAELRAEIAPLTEAQLRSYEVLGWVYFLSDQERLLLMLLRGVNLAQRSGAAEAVAKSLASIGFGLGSFGLHRIAARYHARSVAIAEQFAMPQTIAFARDMQGVHLFCLGRWAEAEADFRSAQRIADEVGDLLLWSDASVLLCELWNETGALDRVLALADEMMQRGREAAFQPALRWGLLSRSKALLRLGRVADARGPLEDCVKLSLAMRDLVGGASAAAELGVLLADAGEIDAAQRLLADFDRQIVSSKIRAYTVGGLHAALAHCALRRLEQTVEPTRALLRQAKRATARALRSARIYGVSLPIALRLRGELAALTGSRAAAERYWRRAVAIAERFGAQVELALALRQLAGSDAGPGAVLEEVDPAYAGRKPGSSDVPPP